MGKNLLRVPTQRGSILVEIDQADTEVRAVGKGKEVISEVEASLESGFDTLVSVADSFHTAMGKLGACIEEGELEMGIKFTGKGSLYVVETTAEATFRAKLKFKAPVPTKS